MKRTLTSKEFWLGVVVGAVVVPYAMGKMNNVKVPAKSA